MSPISNKHSEKTLEILQQTYEDTWAARWCNEVNTLQIIASQDIKKWRSYKSHSMQPIRNCIRRKTLSEVTLSNYTLNSTQWSRHWKACNCLIPRQNDKESVWICSLYSLRDTSESRDYAPRAYHREAYPRVSSNTQSHIADRKTCKIPQRANADPIFMIIHSNRHSPS